MPIRVISVFGTRPEAIKMASLVSELENHPEIESYVCLTGQHREMLQQVIDIFDIRVDHNLDVMKSAQGLTHITSAILTGIEPVFDAIKPDIVLVHGDTTTTLAASLAAFYQKIPVGHVEAGLRTGDNYAPWPEEMNRRITDVITELYFAPTDSSAANLRREGIPVEKIHITGNTVVDSLLIASEKIKAEPFRSSLEKQFAFLDSGKKLVLVTGHRRENFGGGFERLCSSLLELSKRDDIELLYPVHLNPNVCGPVNALLGNRPNIHLIEPADYLSFVYLMSCSFFIITDSGGIQEEAPSLGKPILVTRDVTERPEAVEAGTVRLVGTDMDRIVAESTALLDDPSWYETMSRAHNPYGDGKASRRIVDSVIASKNMLHAFRAHR